MLLLLLVVVVGGTSPVGLGYGIWSDGFKGACVLVVVVRCW